MFSWICPKCGREVPPSYNECPNCAPAAAKPPEPPPPPRPYGATRPAPPPPPAAARTAAPPPRQPEPLPPGPREGGRPPKRGGVLFGGGDLAHAEEYSPPPPQSYAPPPPAYAPPQPPPQYVPPPPAPSSGLPSWLLMLLVAMVVGGIVAGAVWLKRRSSDVADTTTEPKMTAESAPAVGSGGHRYAKFIELSGFRVVEDNRQRATVKMAVTNHSGAEIGDLDMNVTLRTSDGKDIGASVVKVKDLGANSTVEATAPLKTKMRAYELPDWQFIRAEFQITSQ